MSYQNYVCKVSVENSFFSFEDFDYLVTEEQASYVFKGSIVKVPFGKSNKSRFGVVVSDLNKTSLTQDLKFIDSIDKDFSLSIELIDLALWMKKKYLCSTYDCLKLMLPKRTRSEKTQTEKWVSFVDAEDIQVYKLTSKQLQVYDSLKSIGKTSVKDLKSFCSVGSSVIDKLIQKGLFLQTEEEVIKLPYDIKREKVNKDILLSDQQESAFATFKTMIDNDGGNGLLFGVTGSGKTQVYIKLIDYVLSNKKNAILLVPEISLTSQLLDIFFSRYGENVAVIHSGLSTGERNYQYNQIKKGKINVVIGTRSAIFAPIENLGIIIMDEEQENSFKSDKTPRYHTREICKFRAKYHHALFLMASATPSVETYSNAMIGNYTISTISERYGNSILPEVEIVDMKKTNKILSPISNRLKELLVDNYNENNQSILLINRRGYNTFVACNDCGHVITCPNCSISLTYHKTDNNLVCHYCGYSQELNNVCPSCNGNNIRYSGFGTQRIEDEIESILPNAKILRMDADTTKKKFSHKKMYDAFKSGEYDVLIGTQMVAKGLDFPKVTLVGIVNADNSLYEENYLAFEKSFNLFTQVIGRSGRSDKKGKAIIQTINPDNEIIKFASEQDYVSFFDNEIQLRKLLIFPPYCDLISINFTGNNELEVLKCSNVFYDNFKLLVENEYSDLKFYLYGPSPAKVYKINKEFRYKIIIKCKINDKVRSLISKCTSKINSKNVKVVIDINPNDIS